MHSITSSKKDSLRISPGAYTSQGYISQIKWLIRERIERRIPEVSLDMHTTENPVVPVRFYHHIFYVFLSLSYIAILICFLIFRLLTSLSRNLLRSKDTLRSSLRRWK